MSKQQGYFIKDPLTGRNLSVSRDVHAVLTREMNKGKEKQQTFQSQMKNITKILSSKYYEGKNGDVEVAVKFKESGAIDLDAPQLALNGELKGLDPETKELVQKTLFQFMNSLSEALVSRNKEAEEKIKQAA